MLIVDEAHGLGVRGGGRGLLHELGLAGAPDVVMTTTLSKALGSQGGVVLGSSAVRAHLIDAARTFIFDTGLAPSAVGAAQAALRVLKTEPWRPDAVLRHARTLADVCGVPEVPQSAVVSVVLGDPQVAVAAATACLDAGVRVGCFRPPTVPAGTSRLRLSARASLECRRAGVGPSGADRRPEGGAPLTVLVVTGTGTGVGKTIATAALASHARQAGIDVAVCKPVQTGTRHRRRRSGRGGAVVRGGRARRVGALPGADGPARGGRAGRAGVAQPR